VTSCTSFFGGSDPTIYEAPETTITDSSPYISVACQSLQVTWLNVALEEICFDVVDEAFISKSEKLSFVINILIYCYLLEKHQIFGDFGLIIG